MSKRRHLVKLVGDNHILMREERKELPSLLSGRRESPPEALPKVMNTRGDGSYLAGERGAYAGVR